MLRKITARIWVKEQPFKYFGLEVGTRMTIVRLADNQLVLISPVKLNNQDIAEINELGIVKYIIAPNSFHYLCLQDCHNIYPEASVIVAPGLPSRVPTIQHDYVLTRDEIDFAGEIEYFFFAGFQASMITGIVLANEIVFYHPESKTLIITDIAFNLDRNFPLITQFASRILGSYNQIRPSILEKVVIKNRETVTTSITRVLEWDFQRVIMAHGTIIEDNAKERLKQGYE